jgi:tRNA pseudouridine-54 N-methylase
VVLVLSESGEDVGTVLAEEETRIRTGGVIVVLGDNNGLIAAEQQAVAAVAGPEYSAYVREVSLGPVPLLASHCIVLVHHYLDGMHVCPPAAGVGRTEEAKGRSNERAAVFAEAGAAVGGT